MIFNPVSSPCAPAAGCSVKAAIPVMPHSSCSSSQISRSRPCACDTGCIGCMNANRDHEAMRSLSLGLYFIVQLPSG